MRAGKKHTVTHDERAGTTAVSYLEGVECADPEAVRTLLERAARLRAVGATAANERSSRSHMVFLLSIRGANAATGQRLNGAASILLAFKQNMQLCSTIGPVLLHGWANLELPSCIPVQDI
jgi:hypothetical protein